VQKLTRDSKNSKTPRNSSKRKPAPPPKGGRKTARPGGWLGWAAALVISASISAAALWWFHSRGYLLYYGDALAHLTIARRLFDSRTPGYEQIGTVWLPLPHWIMSWFARHNAWWLSGLAGAIPAAIAQALAGLFLFAALRHALASTTAALVGLLLFLLNPNAAYLGAIPMTEPFFAAAFWALAYCVVRGSVWGAGLAVCAATLTRYDGWFLIPFVAAYFVWRAGLRGALVFSLIASAGPLYWLGHNWFYYSDPLEFYHGTYSAKAIYQRALDQGMARYPGDHAWFAALAQLREAVRLTAGTPLAILGLLGTLALLWKRAFALAGLLLLPPLFYWLSIYFSGTPIFVPTREPYSYYNTRYALAALPWLVTGAAALVAAAPKRLRILAVLLAFGGGMSTWISYPRAEAWICWKESQVNSVARRAWTDEAAEYLARHYRGGGVLTSLGDQAGIFMRAGLPLNHVVHEGNGPDWLAQVYGRPEHFLHQRWVVARSGDPLAELMMRAQLRGPRYEKVKTVAVKDAPVLEIYRLVERMRR